MRPLLAPPLRSSLDPRSPEFEENRAAMLDIGRDALDIARERATEALELAQLMERPSETLQAQVNLAEVLLKEDRVAGSEHLATLREQAAGQVATWARDRANNLLHRQEDQP